MSALLALAVERAAHVPRLLVACDFDGTIAPIVDDPRCAQPALGALPALLTLAALPQTHCAIISAREHDDLAACIAHPTGLLLAGEYGRTIYSDAPIPLLAREQLTQARSRLEEIVTRYRGAWIERKRHAITLHVRAVPEPLASIALSVARASLAPLRALHAVGGAASVEWCTFAPSKALALAALRQRFLIDCVVMAGDSAGDEDAFATAQPRDVTIKVGAGDTLAAHRVDTPAQLVWALQTLAQARSDFTESARHTPDTAAATHRHSLA
jgi:trehalose 6-phosphate phosphatase